MYRLSAILAASLFPLSAMAATCPAASPDQSVVAMAGPTLSDGNCGSWAISATAQATYNGTAIPGTANVKQLALAKNVVWQLNTAGNWYSITRSAAGVFSSPVGPTTTSPLTAKITPTLSLKLPSGVAACVVFPEGSTYLYDGKTVSKTACP